VSSGNARSKHASLEAIFSDTGPPMLSASLLAVPHASKWLVMPAEVRSLESWEEAPNHNHKDQGIKDWGCIGKGSSEDIDMAFGLHESI